jgi:hypothetical protein
MGLADLVVVDHGHAQGPRMRDCGAFGDPRSSKTALLIECGQHWAAASAEVAYAACIRMMERLAGLHFPRAAGSPMLREPIEICRQTAI